MPNAETDPGFAELAVQLAPRIHEHWRRLCRERGWAMQYDMDYVVLPEDVKADNVAAALRIPRVLALVGLRLVPEDAPEAEDQAAIHRIIDANIERLAEEEHLGWLEQKRRSGWTFAEDRDDAARRHPSMRPYRELTPADQEKDRNYGSR